MGGKDLSPRPANLTTPLRRSPRGRSLGLGIENSVPVLVLKGLEASLEARAPPPTPAMEESSRVLREQSKGTFTWDQKAKERGECSKDSRNSENLEGMITDQNAYHLLSTRGSGPVARPLCTLHSVLEEIRLVLTSWGFGEGKGNKAPRGQGTCSRSRGQ